MGVTTPLFFEIDAGVLATMLASALAHEATVILDIGYAKKRRSIPDYEQHTHSFLEVLPFVAVAVTAFLNPDQARALVGVGPERPRFRFRLQHPRLPLAQVAAIVGVTGLLGVAPHVEELIRCLRVKPTLAPLPPPPEPRCQT